MEIILVGKELGENVGKYRIVNVESKRNTIVLVMLKETQLRMNYETPSIVLLSINEFPG